MRPNTDKKVRGVVYELKRWIMNERKLKNYLEIITNTAVLLVAVAVLSAFTWSYFTRTLTPELQSGFKRGQDFTQLPPSIYSGSTQTLIIALNTKCSYCSESLPFYKRLAEIQRRNDRATRVVAIFPDAEDEVRQYTRQNQLDIETIPAVDFRMLDLAGTPTITLVDNSGKVLDFWIGKLSEDSEQSLRRLVNRNYKRISYPTCISPS